VGKGAEAGELGPPIADAIAGAAHQHNVGGGADKFFLHVAAHSVGDGEGDDERSDAGGNAEYGDGGDDADYRLAALCPEIPRRNEEFKSHPHLAYYCCMAENLIAEIRQLLQDIVAPDLKALTVKVDGVQKQLELSEKSTSAQLDAFRAEVAAFRAEIGAFRAEVRSEFQAQRNLLQSEVLRETMPIRERVASLEARRV
jgi:hypothetical protein